VSILPETLGLLWWQYCQTFESNILEFGLKITMSEKYEVMSTWNSVQLPFSELDHSCRWHNERDIPVFTTLDT